MVNLFVRYEGKLLNRIVNALSEIMEFDGHRLKVSVHLKHLDGLELRDILANGPDSYEFSGDNIIVGVSLSQTSLHDLRNLSTHTIKSGLYHFPLDGDVAIATKNPNLTVIKRADGRSILVAGYVEPTRLKVEFPAPVQKDYSEDSELAVMLKNHDWYYSYSDSLSVYKNGERQYKEMIARLNTLGCADPAKYLADYLKSK